MNPSVPAPELFHPHSEPPAPARIQMPAPGSVAAAVVFAPLDEDTDPFDPPDWLPAVDEDLVPTSSIGLTLVPSLGAPTPPPDEPTDPLADDDDNTITARERGQLIAIEVARAVLAQGASESEKAPDSYPMDLSTGEFQPSLGVRLFRQLPPVRGLTRFESLLLGALGAAAPLVLAGAVLVAWSVSKAVADAPPPPPVVLPAPAAAADPPEIAEPEVAEPEAPEPEVAPEPAAPPPPVVAPPRPVAPSERRTGPARPQQTERKSPPPAPATAIDPWAQAPVVVPVAPPSAPAPDPDENPWTRKKKEKEKEK